MAKGEGGIPLISAVILAAGSSKRMGQPKQMLLLGKATILERTVSNYLASRAGRVIVVLGHRAEEMMERLAGLPVRIMVNPDYREGMGKSIAYGVSAVDGQAAGIMLALAEQPFTGPETIDRVIEEFSAGSHGIVVPVWYGRRGHPVIFAASYRPELEAISGDTGARHIMARHEGDVREVNVESDGIVTDMDTMGDYLLAKRKLEVTTRRDNE